MGMDDFAERIEAVIAELTHQPVTRIQAAVLVDGETVESFGPDGRMIPELSGPYSEVSGRVLELADSSTTFMQGSADGYAYEVPRELWRPIRFLSWGEVFNYGR